MGMETKTYWRGDESRYTGKSEVLHGQVCYEIEIIEGHMRGERKWTYRAPGEMTANLDNNVQ